MGDKQPQNGPLLTAEQRKVLAAMLVLPSIRKVAQKTGIHRHKIHRWLRKKHFAAALNRASAVVFEAAMSQARLATVEAVETIRRVMRSKDDEVAMQAALHIIAAGHDANVALKALHAARNKEGISGDGAGGPGAG